MSDRMHIEIQPKTVDELVPTDILFQTSYWGQVKSRLGWESAAFDFSSSTGQKGDFLLLSRPIGQGLRVAYVPQGPESGPDPDTYGLFLETLSQTLVTHLGSTPLFIRYDLPWDSPYATDAPDGAPRMERPAVRLQELRMNIGTCNWNLRKAPIDLTVADALVVDLDRSEEELLGAMKAKTRYNIRLSQRKGVRIENASADRLPSFYRLYVQTAERNGFLPGSYGHFSALFSPLVLDPGGSELLFLLATKDRDLLAGAVVLLSGRRATYLFGASANERRNLMGSYAVHWEAMKLARQRGCLTYDMGSVSPSPDPLHPFYGMYRFKTGFGGEIVHRSGSWDYPFDLQRYETFRHFESSGLLTQSEEKTGI